VKILPMVLILLLSPCVALADLIVFKRYTDSFVVPKHHIEHTVWVLDAPNIILDPLNAEGRDIVDAQAQRDFIERIKGEVNSPVMQALVMVSFIAKAKAKQYAITVVPSAVQVDRDGTVVRTLTGRLEIERFLGALDDE